LALVMVVPALAFPLALVPLLVLVLPLRAGTPVPVLLVALPPLLVAPLLLPASF
jgi:hypothetical protein